MDSGDKTTITDEVVKMAESVSPELGQRIIAEYQNIPQEIRDTIEKLHDAMSGLSQKSGVDGIKGILEKFKEQCEDYPEYEELYNTAKNQANQEIAEMFANGDMSVLD